MRTRVTGRSLPSLRAMWRAETGFRSVPHGDVYLCLSMEGTLAQRELKARLGDEGPSDCLAASLCQLGPGTGLTLPNFRCLTELMVRLFELPVEQRSSAPGSEFHPLSLPWLSPGGGWFLPQHTVRCWDEGADGCPSVPQSVGDSESSGLGQP